MVALPARWVASHAPTAFLKGLGEQFFSLRLSPQGVGLGRKIGIIHEFRGVHMAMVINMAVLINVAMLTSLWLLAKGTRQDGCQYAHAQAHQFAAVVP
jgi:hypothetical protein